jgi:hypothetical protein
MLDSSNLEFTETQKQLTWVNFYLAWPLFTLYFNDDNLHENTFE